MPPHRCTVWYNYHPIMFYGMYKTVEQTMLILILKDVSDFERGLIVGAQMAGASVTKTVQLAAVSIRTVTEVTSAFRSMGKTSINMVRNRG